MEVEDLDFSQFRAQILSSQPSGIQLVPEQSASGGGANLDVANKIEQERASSGSSEKISAIESIPRSQHGSTESRIPSQLEGSAKTNGEATQKSVCTEPVSQWAYDQVSNLSRLGHTTDQETSTRSYMPGESGYVAFDSGLEKLAQDREKDSDDLDAQNLEDYDGTQDVRTEIFPESYRFQLPKTPATTSKKRDALGNFIEPPNTTPRLPANPFRNQQIRDVGEIGLTQVWEATQWTENGPPTNGFPSEPLSEKPSPGMFEFPRPSTAQPSSPLRLERSSIQRSVTEPYTNWKSDGKSSKGSPRTRRARFEQDNSPLPGRSSSRDELDQDFEEISTAIQRRRRNESIERKARAQLHGVTAKSRTQIRSKTYSSPNPKLATKDPIIVSDNSEGSNSEAETEHEETGKKQDDLEADELGEDNKENVPRRDVLVPGTTVRRSKASGPRKVMPSSSPLDRRVSKAKIVDTSPAQLQNDQGREPISIQLSGSEDSKLTTDPVAIADSQLSQQSRQDDIERTCNNALPISSDGSKKVIHESQSYKNSDTPFRTPLDGSTTEHHDATDGGVDKTLADLVRDNSADSDSDESTSDELNSSPPEHPTENKTESANTETTFKKSLVSGSLLSQNTNVSASSPPIRSMNASRIRKTKGTNQIAIPSQEASRSTIPESMPSGNTERQGEPMTSGSAGVQEIMNHKYGRGNKKAYSSSAASTVFHEASSQLSSLGQTPPEPTRSISNSTSISVEKPSRPRGLMEIAETEMAESQEELDLSFNLMTAEDTAFKQQMDELSSPPVDAKLKRKRRLAKKRNEQPETRHSHIYRVGKIASSPLANCEQQDQTPMQKDSDATSEDPLVNDYAEKENVPARAKPIRVIQPLEQDGPALRARQDTKRTITSSDSVVVPERSSSLFMPSSESEVATVNDGRVSKAAVSSLARRMTPETPSVENPSHGSDSDLEEAPAAPLPMIYPTRVLAPFTGSPNGYFAATCCSFDGSNYVVRFDDGNTCTLPPGRLKRFELRPGDEIRVYLKGYRKNVYIVQSLQRSDVRLQGEFPKTDVFGNDRLVAILKQGKKDKEEQSITKVFPVENVYCTITMWSALKDREYVHQESLDLGAAGYKTPSYGPGSPARIARSASAAGATPDTAARRAGPLFAHTTFVMTAIADHETRKGTEAIIRAHGGTILGAGFEELFRFSNATTQSESTSTPRSPPSSSLPEAEGHVLNYSLGEQFRLKDEALNSSRTILIADKHSRSTKYFQALALGVPCIHTRWVRDCIAQRSLLDWRSYLLAAGESAFLDGAIVSRWLPDYGSNDERSAGAGSAWGWDLKAMVDRRSKWLDGKRVLLVSAATTGLGVAKAQAYVFITLALGAREVRVAEGYAEARQILSSSRRGVQSTTAATAVETPTTRQNCAWDWIFCVDEDGGRNGATDWEGTITTATVATLTTGGSSKHPSKRRKTSSNNHQNGSKIGAVTAAADEPNSPSSKRREGLVESLGLSRCASKEEDCVRVVGTEFLVQSLILGRLLL